MNTLASKHIRFKKVSVVAMTIMVIVVFLIMSMILFILVGKFLTRQYESEILSDNSRYIHYTNRIIDENIHETAFGILLKYANNYDYRIDSFSDSLYIRSQNTKRIMDAISYDTQENPLLYDIIIFNKTSRKVMNKKGLFSMSFFMLHNQWAQGLLDTAVQGDVQTGVCRPGDSDMYVFQHDDQGVLLFYTRQDGLVVMVVVDSDQLYEMVNEVNMDPDNLLVVLDAEGQMLYSSKEGELAGKLASLTADKTFQQGSVSLEGNDYIVNQRISANNGFRYITFYPGRLVTEKVRKITSLNIALYALVYALFIAFAVFLWGTVLNPLKRVTRKATSQKEKAIRNEFELIGSMFNELDFVREEFRGFRDEHRHLIRQRLLESLLSQEKPDLDEEGWGKWFRHPYFKIYILADDDAAGLPDIERIAGLLRRECASELDYECFQGEKKQWNLVINYSDERMDPDEPMRRIMKGGEKGLLCFASGVAKSVSQIGMVYRRMDTLILYRRVEKEGAFFTQDDIVMNSAVMTRLLHKEDVICQHMLSGHEQEIRKIMDSLLIIGPEIPYREAVHCLETLKGMIDKTVTQSGIELPDLLDADEYRQYEGFESDSPAVNCECYDYLFKRIMIYISQQIRQRRDEEDAIIVYIRQHFNQDISLQQIADVFNMNTNYLSIYIKKRLGISYTQFIANLRLEKAEYLLKTTHLSIQDIAMQIGMYNNNSFIRFFKNAKGFTPSEYRRNCFRQDA